MGTYTQEEKQAVIDRVISGEPSASMLQWAGVDIKTAQVLVVHNDYDATANVYTHGDNDLKVAAASLQNEYLNNMLKTQK